MRQQQQQQVNYLSLLEFFEGLIFKYFTNKKNLLNWIAEEEKESLME